MSAGADQFRDAPDAILDAERFDIHALAMFGQVWHKDVKIGQRFELGLPHPAAATATV